MEGIIKKTVRTFALLIALCATGGAWAEVLTYGSTGSSGDGYYISNDLASPTTVFTSLSLRDMITKYKISGYIGGGWIPEGEVDGVYNAVVGKDTLTVQFQKADGESVKGTIVNFRQSGANITAYAVKYSYKTYSDSATATASLGVDLTVNPTGGGTAPTSDTANGYGIYGITLTSLDAGESPIAVSGVVSKPLAVWNGNFPTTNDGANTHNGYKLSVKGNTAAADGSKITLASSKPGVEILHVDNNGDKTVANTPFAAIYNMYNLTTSGSRMLGTSIANNGGNFVYNRTMAGLANTTFNSWHSGGSEGTEQIALTFSGNATTVYSIGFLYRPSSSTGTDLYFDGVHVMEADGIKSGSDANNIYGVSLGGSSGTETRWNFPNAEISYVALLNSESEADIAAWSLNSMTSSANFSDSGTISDTTDYSAKGINLNGGTVALSGDVTAAAVFVWADTTLSFASGATLTVGGDGLGPIYIADGATLTIDATSCSTSGNAAEDLVKGVFYGKSQVSVKTPATFGYSLSDIGIQIGKYLKWNYANGVVSWTSTSVQDMGAAATYSLFDTESGKSTSTTYTGNVADCGADRFWKVFGYGSTISGYSAPGYVLRLGGEYSETATKTIGGTFGPLTLGGLIVESDAGVYTIAQTSGDRSTIIGDPRASNGVETWFRIEENISFNRNGWFYITGTVNLDVASGKTLTLQTARSDSTQYPMIYASCGASGASPVAGGTLKLHGAGQIAATTLTASGATLDYSDLAPDRATAYIVGALVVNSSTQFKFPASTVWPYKVASSISGLTDGYTTLAAANYTVGGVAGTSPLLLLANGTAIPITTDSATIDSAEEYTLAGLFGSALETGDYTINVDESATLNIPSDTTVFAITFNVAEGKTLTISGSTLTGTTGVCINGPGKVVTSTVGQLAGGLKTNADGLGAGVYELLSWTTPQQYTTRCAGYGTWDVNTEGLASGLTAEPVYGAKAVYLRVYDTETQAARKPLVIWPYGDSITEGYNQQHTGTNYRILLYQKLRMLGYNVKSTGVYDLDDGYNAVDPSGTPLTDDDKWHSAKHGAPVSAGLSGLPGRGALIENVDTLCVQAGTPDVVLVHIGVNDLSVTDDVDSVFEAWTNVVGRLVRNLPNSKIVVSTALYGRDNQTTRNSRVTSYNDKIKALIADMPTEWSGHVVLADLCSLVDSNTTGILYSLDTVHPDWWGYDQMAEGWLSQVTNLYTNPAAVDFPSQAALPAIPDSSELGAANKSELDDYRAGFTKYGDIRVEHGQDINNIVYTNVDANAAASNIGRVGYFVEYVRTDNHAHKWVWVDMDAFGDRDIATVGLPASSHQQVVNHLHVYSNHGAIDNVAADDDTASGFIEFTPNNISHTASSVEGAPADSCPTSNQMDWNDTIADNGQYAAMQVFRIAPPSGRPAQTIFAFNNWRSFDSNPAEFGIGNFAQHFWWSSGQTLDYIYTRTSEKMNASAYTVKTIEIWTKPVYTAPMSATGNFSGLEFSPTLPSDISECDLVVNVTDDATLTFDSAKTVGSITFNIAENKTLTLDGVTNLTVGKVVVSGPGKIAFTASPAFGALRIASDATIALASGQAIALDGALTVESGVTLTMEPATMAALSSDMISAGSVVNNGTIEFTAPDEGSDYSISITGTAITLRRVTKNAFTYNPVPGENTPTGWISSWGGEPLATTSLRVGPSSDIPYVYHVASGKHPWVNLDARTSGFSYAIYADVSQMESDKGVITAFGNTSMGLFLYRDGNYVKLAHVVNSSITTLDWVPGVAISAGYHLYTVTFDPTTGAAALYLDDGSTYAATDGSTHAHLGTQGLNNGFQLGSVFQGVGTTGFHLGAGLAVCAVRGYDAVLDPVEVETLSESFPATDGNVTWNVAPDNTDNTVIVTSATFGDSNYIAQSKGTLTIPAGSEVNVKHIRVLNNSSSSDRATVNIAGTLNITSESSDPNTWADRNNNKGVLFGHWAGQATYNITGSLIAPNTYIETVYTASTQLLDISGGTVKTKALYANNGNSTVKLRDGGTLEVAEILSSGSAITKEFKYGTFRITADATETRAINFSAAGGYATTLDPYGNTLTLQSAALTGSGDITVADSSVGGNGTVVFVGGSSYAGRLILTDANAANIDISGYTGTVLCEGTAAETIAMFDGFAGPVYFTGNVDATGIDLSDATVHIADNCSFTADAGSEGTLVLGSGVSVTLNVTEEVANYEGYFPTVSGSGTISYYQTNGTPGELTGDDHVNGNNLMPYYNVWVPSANGENNTISADAAARWRLTRLPDANKNVAFKLSGDTTVTIDATITFKDVQVYGTGSLTIQQSGDNVLTVGKGLYTTANTTVQIDSGLAFESGAMLEIESAVASGKYVGVNCGTAESPFEIPFITGSGLLIIAEGKGLTTGSMTVGTLTVQGALALTGSGSATTASVYVGGVIDVSSGTSLTVPTLTVNGTVNMGGNTLSATTISGTGRVEYANKLPDTSSWATGTESTGWRGTVAFSQTANLTGPNLNSYGNAYSTVALTGVSGSNTYLPNDDIATNVRIEGPVTINNGNPVTITTDGWDHARVIKISSLEVNDELAFVKTGNTSWGTALSCWYYAEVLKCGADGSINIGNQFGLRVDAVDFAEAPSASSCLVPISLTRGGDDKADGVLYGPNGVAGEVIPVTVDGVANGQKLVHATVNETTGLYLAVASVTVNETTTYYPTLAAVKAAVGNNRVTINLLANTSDSIALAYGQMLNKGTTTYEGTVSAADSSAKIVLDGTTYKVKYGTIFSVY